MARKLIKDYEALFQEISMICYGHTHAGEATVVNRVRELAQFYCSMNRDDTRVRNVIKAASQLHDAMMAYGVDTSGLESPEGK